MPRVMRPEEALAACFPTVAMTWHPERNGDRTPQTTSAKNSYEAWWRCLAGHDWQEVVATRTALPAWKNGDRAACRVCVGYHVIVAFDCGHTTEARAEFAEPERGCPACRKVRRQARQDAYFAQRKVNSAAAKKLYAECREQAQDLLSAVPLPMGPAPLVFEWQRSALHELRGTIVNEQLFGDAGAVERLLAGWRSTPAELLPPVADLRAAVVARQPVQILGKAHWPTGWLHHLGVDHAAAPADDGTLLAELEATLTAQVEALVVQFGRHRQLPTGGITNLLTGTIASWAYAQETSQRSLRWNVFRELSLPVAPGGSTRFGRADVTVMRPTGPDLVVELDSTHKEHNVEKLAFAHAAGATAIWVRWHGGRVEQPPGVAVIDLVAATRGLAA